MPDYLPTPVRVPAALAVGVFGLVVGPVVEVVQGIRRRRYLRHRPRALDR